MFAHDGVIVMLAVRSAPVVFLEIEVTVAVAFPVPEVVPKVSQSQSDGLLISQLISDEILKEVVVFEFPERVSCV